MAVVVSELDQVTAESVGGPPSIENSEACRRSVSSTNSVAAFGVTVIVVTGATTRTFAVPLTPSVVAVITADPRATACTRPVSSTKTVFGFELDQPTGRSGNEFP